MPQIKLHQKKRKAKCVPIEKEEFSKVCVSQLWGRCIEQTHLAQARMVVAQIESRAVLSLRVCERSLRDVTQDRKY